MGDDSKWWWPRKGGYWPAGCPRQETIEAFAAMIRSFGYADCDTPDLEDRCEKIALYALGDTPTHAARQMSNGMWTSKIGQNVDIHHTLLGLEGPLYGQVVRHFRKMLD